jgi:exo-beta-1,3-glucanase (GH17 family)
MRTALFLLLSTLTLTAAEHPLFRDLVGINGHTVAFKPELYKPVCGVVRDYHPVKWDLAEDTSKLPDWPFAKNKVSWEQVYGSWHKAGLRISVCLQFDDMKSQWKDMAKDSHAYAKSFAQNFGPGGKWPFVEWIELGNEPGLYDDASYRTIFEAMARGIREGNPQMKIATCNVEVGPSERYWKGVDCLKGFDDLYDVVHIHRYAIAEQWPIWRRTYPEDPKVPFLSSIQKLIDWCDANAVGKPVWVTEFGWDSSTKKPDPKGEWAKWLGSTDEEQAQWIVRSFLLFSAMDVEKGFVYFFNDKDEPKLHAASGLTRNYEPKPAYHAVAWMLKSLANCRFSRVIKQSLETGYVYEFTPEKAGEPIIWAAWHPTGREVEMRMATDGKTIVRAEQMPLDKGPAPVVKSDEGHEIHLSLSEKPILVWLADSTK